MSDQRLYVPGEDPFGPNGYPIAWLTIKDDVREAAGHRCIRCGHPYRKGEHASGEWSACDVGCLHQGDCRWRHGADGEWEPFQIEAEVGRVLHHHGPPLEVEARYRILTVHHLNGIKADCRWWNLMAACQRCHLTIQGKVVMDRVWPHEHTGWFKPYVAGYYAWRYLGEDIDREEAERRMAELLALEVRQLSLEAS